MLLSNFTVAQSSKIRISNIGNYILSGRADRVFGLHKQGGATGEIESESFIDRNRKSFQLRTIAHICTTTDRLP